MAKVNDTINGYRLKAVLHSAAKTQVYEVVEASSSRHFAMKILTPEAADDSEQRAMLFHEADVGIDMKHDNVVHIIKVNKAIDTPHFIMEFFPSGSLGARLKKQDMAFIKEHSRRIFKEAATGLAYMTTSGYVHRDVKPDNILVNPLGETRIIDFAITKKYPTGLKKLFHRKGKPQGTPSYMSPEQIRDEVLDSRADIYSFGCTLFELTTGRKPITGSTQNELLTKQLNEKPVSPASLNPEVTEDFGRLVLKMLAKDRDNRQENFHEVLMEMKRVSIYKSVKE